MEDSMIKELESAAHIIMSPPNSITKEQRQNSEAVFLNFRKTKNPYALCQQILEKSTDFFVLFETGELLKLALVSEWQLLNDEHKIGLRQYLLNYIMQRELPHYVKEKILQVIAIMIKRSSIEDFGIERSRIIDEAKSMIMSDDIVRQNLACSIIYAIMQEYFTTVKSGDTGLTFEDHFKAKKHFEKNDLRKIFVMVLEALGMLLPVFDATNGMQINLMQLFLQILETVLTWGYISPLFPKRLINIFENVYKSDLPPLRPNVQWLPIMGDPKFLEIFFNTYWKVRDNSDLQAKAMTCLVQLSTLNGPLMQNEEFKEKNFRNFLTHFIQLVSNIELQEFEVSGVSMLIRKLLLYNPPKDMADFPEDLVNSLLQRMFNMTIHFAERLALEDMLFIEDTPYTDAFENMLEAWLNIIHGKEHLTTNILPQLIVEMFNKYIQCHLSAPDGTRSIVINSLTDEINDFEMKDHDKYKEQLIIIGIFGREILGHSLPLLSKLLEDKTRRLHGHLQRMFTNMPNDMNNYPADSKLLIQTLYEDIDWLLLISANVLSTDSDPYDTIPSEIMNYSIQQTTTGAVDITTSLKVLASPTQCISDIPNGENATDHVIRLISAVFRLCEIEKVAGEAKMGGCLSPEVSCTLMYFLKMWVNSYLLPLPDYYSTMSESIKAAFGVDTPGGAWTVNLLLNKICTNLQSFSDENEVIEETIDLFNTILRNKHKCTAVFNSEYFKTMLSLRHANLPLNAKKGILKGIVTVGYCITDDNTLKKYFEEICQPINTRYKQVTTHLNASFHNENVKMEIIQLLEEVKACFSGASMFTGNYVFENFKNIIIELPTLLELYHNYMEIVELILHILCEISLRTFYYEPPSIVCFSESCMSVIRTYMKHNQNRISTVKTAEEENLQDLLLLLKLLNCLLSRNLISAIEEDSPLDNTEICAFALIHILPMITMDLLQYPDFCLQYYKTITIFFETKSHKICTLSPDLTKQILRSVELGLLTFCNEIQSLCFDFIQIFANTIFFDKNPESFMYQLLLPFLKIVLEMILTQQVGTENKTECAKALFSLMCCYKSEYVELVKQILEVQQQTNPVNADRLSKEFIELTRNCEITFNRITQSKFIDKFDKFFVNISFLFTI